VFEPVASADLDAHLAGLNRNFTNWGSRDQLDWVLRAFGGQPADAFALREDGRLAAGSIVSYRAIGQAEVTHRVGIMTASWTDPEMRGRGLFSAMIDQSADLARQRGAVALLAFVTADNASRRRLEAAGSSMTPSWYLSVPADSDGRPWPEASDVGVALATLEVQRKEMAADRARFVYPTALDAQGHLLDRSSNVRVLASASGAIAVVQRVDRTLRVLAGTESPDLPCGPGVDDLFRFTTDARIADQAATVPGGRIKPGYLTVLPLTEGWRPPTAWFVESGDRM
jgi:GNAT superfamily N-acetyltransferase